MVPFLRLKFMLKIKIWNKLSDIYFSLSVDAGLPGRDKFQSKAKIPINAEAPGAPKIQHYKA